MSHKGHDEWVEAIRESNEELAAHLIGEFNRLLIEKQKQEWWHQQNEDEEWIENAS